jgi:hypothetical protein
MMTEFKAGQRVKVEFGGTLKYLDDETMEIRTDDDYFYYIAPGREPGITITPLDPENWPPQVGDIWEADGGEFLARKSVAGRDAIVCIPVDEMPRHYAMDTEPLKALNPVLVRRRGQS